MADLNRLNQAIKERGISQRYIANQIGLSEVVLSRKLHGQTEFTVSEANAISSAIKLTTKERNDIFFAKQVI